MTLFQLQELYINRKEELRDGMSSELVWMWGKIMVMAYS